MIFYRNPNNKIDLDILDKSFIIERCCWNGEREKGVTMAKESLKAGVYIHEEYGLVMCLVDAQGDTITNLEEIWGEYLLPILQLKMESGHGWQPKKIEIIFME